MGKRSHSDKHPSKEAMKEESTEPFEVPYYQTSEESANAVPEPSPPYKKIYTENNVLKIIGPRKRVRYAKKQHFTRPTSAVKKRRWFEKIKKWGKEEGIKSTYEVGESSHAPTQPAHPQETDSALEVMVARMERMNLQTRTVSDEMNIIEGNARYMADQIQHLRVDSEHYRAAHEVMRDQVDTMTIDSEAQDERILNLEFRVQGEMRNEIDTLMIDHEAHRDRMEDLEFRMRGNEQQIVYVENRARVAEEKADAADCQLVELMKNLVRIFKKQ